MEYLKMMFDEIRMKEVVTIFHIRKIGSYPHIWGALQFDVNLKINKDNFYKKMHFESVFIQAPLCIILLCITNINIFNQFFFSKTHEVYFKF